MFKNYFFRNARADDLLELFLVAAVATVLIVRFYLKITGYPQLGGSHLHIAHMLFGGLLMLAGLVLSFTLLGARAQRLAAVAGGIGFGLFIDELGKFITKDNNYFFQPTVALIYAIFMALFVGFRSLGRNHRLSQQENLLNALAIMEEAVIHDMDEHEQARVRWYLNHADQTHPLVQSLKTALASVHPLPVKERALPRRLVARLHTAYSNIIGTRLAIRIIDVFFVVVAAYNLGKVAIVILGAVFHIKVFGADAAPFLTIALLELASIAVSTYFIVKGIIALRSSRLKAYELFLKATLVNIFLTQFFEFYREQFSALPEFIFQVLIYLALRYLISQERLMIVEIKEKPKTETAPISA
jgi:hypothetical protein